MKKSVLYLITVLALIACREEVLPAVEEPTTFAPDPGSACGSAYYSCVGKIDSVRAIEYQECARLYGTGGADYYGCIEESESDTKEELSQCKKAYDSCEQS